MNVDTGKYLEVLRFKSEAQRKGIASGIRIQLVGIFGDAQPTVECQFTNERGTVPQCGSTVDVDHRHLGMPRPANRVRRVGIIVGIQSCNDGAANTCQGCIESNRGFTGNVRFADQGAETRPEHLDILGVNVDEGVICTGNQCGRSEVKHWRLFVIFGGV
ncbi:hypothetical protein D3C80_1182550 [compost metagenome]